VVSVLIDKSLTLGLFSLGIFRVDSFHLEVPISQIFLPLLCFSSIDYLSAKILWKHNNNYGLIIWFMYMDYLDYIHCGCSRTTTRSSVHMYHCAGRLAPRCLARGPRPDACACTSNPCLCLGFTCPCGARAARPRAGTLALPPLLTRIATYATPDLLLKHPDATLTTYV
jgi:hypothetical protein